MPSLITHFRDHDEVEILYDFDPGAPQTWTDPGYGPYAEIEEILLPSGESIDPSSLTKEEWESLEQKCIDAEESHREALEARRWERKE